MRTPPPDPQFTKLFAWFFILTALPIGLYTLTRTYDKLASASWPKAQAEILASDMYRQSKSGQWCVSLQYRYVVDGNEFISRRMSTSQFGETGCDADRKLIAARLERYRPGARIKIRYLPADPGKAIVYVRELDAFDFFFPALTIVLAAGGIKTLGEAKRQRQQQMAV